MISHKNEYQNKKYSELNATKVSSYSFVPDNETTKWWAK